SLALALVANAFIALAACGGSSGSSNGAGPNGGPGGGSALCGPNGANNCGAARQCDPTLGCVECTADTQCPASARRCIAGACVECSSNADCGGATPVCWPSTNTCHAACTSNAQCTMAGHGLTTCNAAGACIGCTGPADCAGHGVCDPTSQVCVAC